MRRHNLDHFFLSERNRVIKGQALPADYSHLSVDVTPGRYHLPIHQLSLQINRHKLIICALRNYNFKFQERNSNLHRDSNLGPPGQRPRGPRFDSRSRFNFLS